MNIKDFSASLKAKQKELDTLMRRELPIKVGRMAKDHYQDNFRKGGFVNGGLQRWPQTKRQNSGSKSAAAGYGPLLSRRNHLFSSVKYTPGDYRVRVANDVEYAPLHNFEDIRHRNADLFLYPPHLPFQDYRRLAGKYTPHNLQYVTSVF